MGRAPGPRGGGAKGVRRGYAGAESIDAPARRRARHGGDDAAGASGQSDGSRSPPQHQSRNPVRGGVARRPGRRADLQPDGGCGDGRDLPHADLAVATSPRRARGRPDGHAFARRTTDRRRIFSRARRDRRDAVRRRPVRRSAPALSRGRDVRGTARTPDAACLSAARVVRVAASRRKAMSTSTPKSLLDLLAPASAGRTAVVAPEQNIRVTYEGLRSQVEALASALARAGVARGDRVGIALPNGLPVIVSFLAASTAGTAAPLNPAYKEDEFRFYLEDTNAQVLILPPDGAEAARRAAGDRVRILTVDMDSNGNVKLAASHGGGAAASAVQTPSVNDVALILHTSGSTGRPKRVP